MKYEKEFEVIKLQDDEKGLIINSKFNLLKNSEIVGVKDITSMEFIDWYIINYYKAPTEECWRNTFFNEVLHKIELSCNSLYVRFTNEAIVQHNGKYHLCANEKNIIEVVSTYEAFLQTMKNRAKLEYLPTYKKNYDGYDFEDGSVLLQDGSGYFSLGYDLESCNFNWSFDECPNKFPSDFPEVVGWRILWLDDKEYKKELMNLYNDDVVLYLSDESTWYDLHDKV
nr:MAG TPA: hypothetical protein [Caudoviricetes sp.]